MPLEWGKIDSPYKILDFSRTAWRILLRISSMKDETLRIVVMKWFFISIDDWYNPKQNWCIFIGSRCIHVISMLTLVLLRGVVPTPPNGYRPWCSKSHSQGVKIAPGTFKFILSLHFSGKNFEPATYTGGRVSFQSWEVRGGWCDPMIFELDILKIFEVICTHKFVCKLELSFSNIFCKKSHENRHVFTIFLRKNQFLPIFYTQNGHFSIFGGRAHIMTS